MMSVRESDFPDEDIVDDNEIMVNASKIALLSRMELALAPELLQRNQPSWNTMTSHCALKVTSLQTIETAHGEVIEFQGCLLSRLSTA